MSEPHGPTDPLNPLVWPEDKSNDLTPEHYAAIGRVATEWAALEATIDTYSLRLAQIEPKIGVCLTSQIAGWARKLDAYIALARLNGATKTIAKLNSFANDMNGFADQRNRTVHDPWVGTAKPHRLEATARRKLRFEFVHIPTEKVLEIGRRITAQSVLFENLADEVEAEMAASRETQPPTSL
jgi:hypothetical protein